MLDPVLASEVDELRPRRHRGRSGEPRRTAIGRSRSGTGTHGIIPARDSRRIARSVARSNTTASSVRSSTWVTMHPSHAAVCCITQSEHEITMSFSVTKGCHRVSGPVRRQPGGRATPRNRSGRSSSSSAMWAAQPASRATAKIGTSGASPPTKLERGEPEVDVRSSDDLPARLANHGIDDRASARRIRERAHALEQRFQSWIARAVHGVTETRQPSAGVEDTADGRDRSPFGGVTEQGRGVLGRRPVQHPGEGGHAGRERGVRVGAHRGRDPDRQRARGELVVGEEHERTVDRADQLGRRTRMPRVGEAFGDAAVDRRTGQLGHDADEPTGRGVGPLAGMSGREHWNDRHQPDERPGAPVQAPYGRDARLHVSVIGGGPPDGRRRHRAGPEQFGDLLERGRPAQLGDLDPAVRQRPARRAG